MAMTLVSTVTVGSGGAASIEFTNIPQTGKDLLLLVSARNASTSSDPDAIIKINNSSSAVYSGRRLWGLGSSALSDSFTNGTSGVYGALASLNDQTSNTFGNSSLYISNYTSSVAKSISFDGVNENNASSARQYLAGQSANITSAVTSLQLAIISNNFAQHTTASLYIIS